MPRLSALRSASGMLIAEPSWLVSDNSRRPAPSRSEMSRAAASTSASRFMRLSVSSIVSTAAS